MAVAAHETPAGGHWRSHALGLAIDSTFALAGFPRGRRPPGDGLRPVSLEQSSEPELRARFASGSHPIAWRRRPTGEPEQPEVLAHPTAGFLMFDPGSGYFRVSPGGERIWCAPSDSDAWRWQRYLLGRVLPLAATVSGLETWHASAVAVDRAAVALMARSGAGKTTIAAELILRGARLLADDVIAVESIAGEPVIHPGPPLISLRTGPRPMFGEAELKRLGRWVGGEPGRLSLSVLRADESMPLRTLYLLETGSGPTTLVEPLPAPDPAALLGGTFNFAIRDPQRLSRQLDTAAAISRQVGLIRVRIPPAANLREVGARLLEHAQRRNDGR